ncbi:MAG: RAMP superfamily CRISPR-associated protein [Ktedonobacteraceae bacterium]
MQYFSLNLETISPLAIRSDHAPTGAGSADYISGTALAGSLAAVYRLYYQQDSPQFERLFLNGQVYYPDLYPATFGSEEMLRALNAPVYALPKTAQSCKRFSGFVPLPDENVEKDERHGARDTLLDWAAFELGSKAQEAGQPIEVSSLLNPLQAHKYCTHAGCGRPMDHLDGFYRRIRDKKLAQAEAEKRLQTHTGINRDTGTVQEGILYNRSVFQEHTRFWGLLKLPDSLVTPLQTFVEEVGLSGLVRVGTGRTRGMGKVYLSIDPLQAEQHNIETFRDNLKMFDDKLRQVAQHWFPPKEYDLALKPFYFAVTLHSPVILRDSLLRYAGTFDKQTLAALLGLPADTFDLLYQSASTRRVTGWNELWGTPRMNEFAIDTGSVFLFSSTVELHDQLCDALFKLEEEGAGERRAEGFGRLRISDPFHLEGELR